MICNQRLLQRRDSLTNWKNNNPVLLDGELGIIEVNGEYTWMVIGDGERSFNSLPKIKLNFDNSVVCFNSTNSGSIVVNKNLIPCIEDNYFIF